MNSLGVTKLGQGPDLVFLHGWGFDSRVWQPVAEALSDSFSVRCIDLPGYGASRDAPITSFDESVAAVLKQIPAGATLVGWSLGGMVALACARREPARLGGLVLVATTPSFVRRDGWIQGMPPLMLGGFKVALRADLLGLLQHFAGLMNHGDQNARDLTRLFKRLGKTDEPIDEALLLGLDWLRDIDLRDALPAIGTPTLLIQGDADPLMPIGAAQAMAEALPQARLETFPGVAHVPFFGDPARFVQCLRDFARSPAPAC